MPSIGTHFLVLDEVTAALRTSSDPNDQQHFRILNQFPEFAALGAVGPDLGFYLGMGPQVVRDLNTVYSFINKIGGVFTDIGSAVGQAGFPNLQNHLQRIGATVDSLSVTVETTITDALFSLISVFHGPLVPPSAIQFNTSETNWQWGDLLHWRVTGQLAKDILSEGKQTHTDEWIAYALGYMTHLSADLVGHAYTNQVVGGPARAWSTRHHLAENFMDAHAYLTLKNQDINSAKLHKRLEKVESSGKLPDFTKMLSNRLLQFYANSRGTTHRLPGEPSQQELTDAYHSMLGLLSLVTDTLYLAPPTFPGISIPPLPGSAGSLTQQAASNFPSSNRSWTLEDFLKAILVAILVGLAFVADLLRLAIDISIGIATYPMAAALYLAQLQLYGIYRAIRWLLVLAAISFPLPDELTIWPGGQFVPCGLPDPIFPHRMPAIQTWNTVWQIGLRLVTATVSNYHYLNYPTTGLEGPPTLSSPYVNEIPNFFINQAKEDTDYVSLWRNISSPTDLNRLNEHFLRTRIFTNPLQPQSVAALGNARDFSLKLIRDELPLDQLNLDSDRGYGYHRWESTGGLPNGPVSGLNFF